MTLKRFVPSLFVIAITHLIRKLRSVNGVDSLDLPMVLKKQIKIQYMDALVVRSVVMHFLPDDALVNLSTIRFKNTPQVLTLAFTGYSNRFFADIRKRAEPFLSAIMPNPDYSNYYYHADMYTTEQQYYTCVTNILAKAVHLFQKFNRCDPQRIVIYCDATMKDYFSLCPTEHVESCINEAVKNPPHINFITIHRNYTPVPLHPPPPTKSFVLAQKGVPTLRQKLTKYTIQNFQSDTRLQTLKNFTLVQCRYSADHYLGKIPLIIVQLDNLGYINRVLSGDMTIIRELNWTTFFP